MSEAAVLKPKFRAGINLPWVRAGNLRLVLPFRRSLKGILIAAPIAALLCIPIIAGWNMISARQDTDLFSVTFDVFIALWILCWSIPFAVTALILVILLVGREVVIVRPGVLSWRLDILGLGGGVDFDAAHICNLRRDVPVGKSGRTWRGPHLAFDYGGKGMEFGSYIDEQRAAELIGRIQAVLGPQAGTGPASTIAAAAATPVAARVSAPPEPAPAAVTDNAAPASPWLLVAANMVPLAGVVLFDWNLGHVMVLYWLESGIIGFFNIAKMIRIGGWGALFHAIFFVGHFGAFMAIHFLFITALFIAGPEHTGDLPLSLVADLARELWPAALALFVSHGYSWRVNFIGRREYLGRTLQKQMQDPYKRIIVMHLTVIGGAFLTLLLKTSVPALALLILLKTGADLFAHGREHRGAEPAPAAAGRKQMFRHVQRQGTRSGN